jgi:hypothetical protein
MIGPGWAALDSNVAGRMLKSRFPSTRRRQLAGNSTKEG